MLTKQLFRNNTMTRIFLLLFACSLMQISCAKTNVESFPDGTPLSDWFIHSEKIKVENLGTSYVLTDHGVKTDSTLVQTQAIQSVIDEAGKNGGGVIVVPKGVFLTGALFFKPGTHLHLNEGAVLKGSDSIAHYPKMPSRMEGQNLEYFAALINAYGVDGFSISGKGTINGNGYKYWEAFWQRRKENKKCTNLEVSRPRLVFVWNCKNVQFQDVKMINSGFWTNHFYQCENVKLLDLYIFSPHLEYKAPSTDAIDIDICTNVLVKGCYMSVNDDAIALKGGKGPRANMVPSNGSNHNILIEDCTFGYCHSAYTNGSESIHNRNIWMRNCTVDGASRLLWFKMRPDTPQNYEYIKLENITGQAKHFIHVYSWKQFFDLKGVSEVPKSYAQHVTLKNIKLDCETFFNVKEDDNFELSDFHLENLDITAKKPDTHKKLVKDFTFENVVINGKKVK